jgi:hypothetical protein
MQLYNFKRLIRKYNSEFTLITLTDGYYDDAGDWIKGEVKETTLNGAVISFKESKIYRSEGTLTTNDRRLFTLEPVPNALKGTKAVVNGILYSIEDCTENAKFTGVYAYTLRYISAFNEKEKAKLTVETSKNVRGEKDD